MTGSIDGVDSENGHRDIDAEFARLREIMASRRFRTSSGLAGEQPYYIYDYPAEQELEVADHIRLLKTQLETMTPADGGYAPQVLVIDLYDVALEIIDERKLLDRVLGIEESRHTIVSADTRTDKFLSLLDTMIAGDTSKLPDFIRDRYEQAKAEGKADIIFITGAGKVYPYIRTHALLNSLQGRIDDLEHPLVLFYPGTFTRSAVAGSTMSLFGRLPGDNYYRARSLREMSVRA